jgi:hypothetical protein
MLLCVCRVYGERRERSLLLLWQMREVQAEKSAGKAPALCGKKLCRAAAAFMERNASMCDEILPRVVVKILPAQIRDKARRIYKG